MKRIMCILVSVFMAFSMICSQLQIDYLTAYGATFNDINQSDVFLKQVGGTACVVASCAMLLRRVSIMRGDTDWRNITESAIKPYAEDSNGKTKGNTA